MTFEKNQYYLGEEATARIVCDNSQCAKDIEHFKFELTRHHTGQENGAYTTQSSQATCAVRVGGIGRGNRGEKTIKLLIPTEDQFHEGAETKAGPDGLPMLKAFSCSYDGRLIKVRYYLRVLVKHNAWNEWGEGNGVAIPVEIMQPPMNIFCQDVVPVPQNWHPQVQAVVQFAQPVLPPVPTMPMGGPHMMQPGQQMMMPPGQVQMPG